MSGPTDRPRRRLVTPVRLVVGVALMMLVLGIANVSSLFVLAFGTSGTGRFEDCRDNGETHVCTVVWTAGDRGGSERMTNLRRSDDAGETMPVRVLGGSVVDARLDAAGLFGIAMRLLFVIGGPLLCLGPLALYGVRRLRRRRALHRMHGSGEQVLHVEGARIRNRDGTPFATAHVAHPGPGFPPSSCRIAVASPTGAPLCTVDFAVLDHRRREAVVYAPDGRPLAVVRRRLMRPSDVEVLGPDMDAAPLVTRGPGDGPGAVEHVAKGRDGERVGTVVAMSGDPVRTALGVRLGLPEPQRAGLLGFALTRDRIFPSPRLKSADGRWAEGHGDGSPSSGEQEFPAGGPVP